MSWFWKHIFIATAALASSTVHLSSLPETWWCRQKEVQVLVDSNRWCQKKKVVCQRCLCARDSVLLCVKGGRELVCMWETEINEIAKDSIPSAPQQSNEPHRFTHTYTVRVMQWQKHQQHIAHKCTKLCVYVCVCADWIKDLDGLWSVSKHSWDIKWLKKPNN